MKEILILGAGSVAKPHARYLLNQNFHVTIANHLVSKAEKIAGNKGKALELNVKNDESLEKLVKSADLVVSLLPYIYHVKVANYCIEHGKDMVTTSYVSDSMNQLDGKAKEAGIILLNETGIDPGIDHMSAMKIIHDVHKKGGKISSFYSYCGGLPAPEANTNPFGYKFSWSPRGVLLAGKNSAKYLKDGKVVEVPSEKLFDHYWLMNIDSLKLEAYPNRNSLPYIDKYGIEEARSMYRGTLRYPGWCKLMKKIVELGLLSTNEETLDGLTYKEWMAKLLDVPEKELEEKLAKNVDEEVMERFKWLGLFSDELLPIRRGSPLDVMVARMQEKLYYEKNERDMVILRHEFMADYSDKKEKIVSTLMEFGILGGDSSMSRTVGLPSAIAVKLILDGKIKEKGVHIPVKPEIYEPILNELEKQGIKFEEKVSRL